MLNDQEVCILSTRAMRFTFKESQEYLKKKGYDVPETTYYRTLGHISSETRMRAFEIAKGFLEEHVNTVSELENIKGEMYKCANNETDHFKKAMIFSKIMDTSIPWIAAFRESTQQIIEKVKKEIDSKEETNSVPWS